MPLWFIFASQCILALAAFLVAPSIARKDRRVWGWVCAGAFVCMLLWPLMRVFPTVAIQLFGAQAVACIELTGLIIPAALLFSIAARQVPRAPDRRAIFMLLAVAGVYFGWAGRWMLVDTLPNLGPTQMQGHVCKQSTEYTCVAASMVTMLRARGIEADELEMARLAHVQVGGGATDSRALWALEHKLAGTGLQPVYETLTLADLAAAPKPLLVQLDWGYFVSHMVPVMAADAASVTIGDPLTGSRTMTTAEFAESWKRQAIMLVRVAKE